MYEYICVFTIHILSLHPLIFHYFYRVVLNFFFYTQTIYTAVYIAYILYFRQFLRREKHCTLLGHIFLVTYLYPIYMPMYLKIFTHFREIYLSRREYFSNFMTRFLVTWGLKKRSR